MCGTDGGAALLKQIRYFQSVVRTGSFTAAAEEHFISQSAISQQIKALEAELGTPLLNRSKRSFTLTEAGKFFYRKSLVLVADYDAILRQMKQITGGSDSLKIGVLKGYCGSELSDAVAEFSSQFPDIQVEVTHANHDALYDQLRSGELDIVLNDQRRAFSDKYVNIVLDIREYYAEISAKSPLAQLDGAEIDDLKNMPLILLASEEQRENERNYYLNDLGFRSEICFTEFLDDAHMQVIQGKGFMPVEGSSKASTSAVSSIRLLRDGKPIIRRYCAFLRTDNDSEHAQKFVELLKSKF